MAGRDEILIETIVVGPLATDCYLVAGGPGAPAALIDPGDDADKILAAAGAGRFTITHIINTHGHYDHISANAAVAAATGAKIYIHQQDVELLKDSEANLSHLLGENYQMTEEIVALRDGDVLDIGEIKLKIIHTPGHTKGGLTIQAGNNLFVGDLIFSGSVGRTDLYGGDFDELIRSIKEKILVFPDDTMIYPGHGPATTVGIELASNPYLGPAI